jgi:integrase
MARPPGVQIARNRRRDGSITYSLRVRVAGTDERIPLGNTGDGWDEVRAEQARRQLLAKIELGQWAPKIESSARRYEQEPTFRELATDWLDARRRNPAIRPRTIELNEYQLRRYLAPFFGEMRPSQIALTTIKEYRDQIHRENEQIRIAADAGKPLRDPRTGLRVRTYSNESINKTVRTLALIVDEAEDAGWVDRNVARGRRTREPLERRRHHAALDPDELIDLLDAARKLDRSRRKPGTLERAQRVRTLRDEHRLTWSEIGKRLDVAPPTAIYLYRAEPDALTAGVRRAIVATLALAGPRVSELCMLNAADVDLAKARLYIADSKTEAGVRAVDIHPRLLDELTSFRANSGDVATDAPAFPTRTGTRRNKDNVRQRVIEPVLARANQRRLERGEPPIRTHVTPHTFRRTYITYAIAAGFDIPYVQAQVGHADPSVTLALYAQVMRQPDRDELRAEIRQLLGVPQGTQDQLSDVRQAPALRRGSQPRARTDPQIKAAKGRAAGL